MASSGAEAPSDDDRAGTLMTVLRPAMITILAAGTATLQARQLLIAQTAKPMGEAAVMSATAGLATAFSLGSFLEFLISPTYGKISDRFGRKPLFLSFLIGPALVRTLCVLITNPYLRIRTLWIDFALARVIGVQPTMAAAMAAQPAARAQLNAAQALGRSSGITRRVGGTHGPGPESTYVATAIIPAVCFGVLGTCLSETHPSKQKAVAPAAAKAASTGETVATKSKSGAFSTLLSDPECGFLALTIAGYEFIQWPPISTVSIIFMKERLGWGPLQAGRFASGISSTVFVGSMLAARLLKLLGATTQVTLAHCCTFVAYSLWGTASSGKQMMLSLLPMVFSAGAKPSLETRFMARAASLGLGKGEAASVLQALGAASRIVAPQLFMRLYLRATSGSGKGRMPMGSPMLLVAAMAVMQEVMHRASLSARGAQ
eukprot:CAMPEP_0180663228 /NCGR_PEP_ID=MMETSP1037_2-20121125/59835_1 /TAXON_ID=632150 /ORGANISM="Azadinium spinosum, Strain 3D9" /LENGTH=431 /DNA_ID=CAMNT_0022690987 /DNA_START=68 /DNA_END=1364 /DNA_ORIENTATION=+